MDKLESVVDASAMVIRGGGTVEEARAKGVYDVQCFDKDGNLKWADEFLNAVDDAGKNVMLDAALAGSSYTVVGPYMGLISSVSYTSVTGTTDTMASHTNWTEAGATNAPTYSGTRKTCVFSAASGGTKSLSAGLTFSMTGSGTLKGCFIVYGTGAVNTIDSTAGVLLSQGTFSADKVVSSGDSVVVSYSFSI